MICADHGERSGCFVAGKRGQNRRGEVYSDAKPPANRDVNEAAKNIVMMDLAILQAEAAAGMYRKPIEVLAREVHYEPLPAEVRAVVIAAWRRGDMLPDAAIEEMVPKDAVEPIIPRVVGDTRENAS
jgi:hypothetical protein